MHTKVEKAKVKSICLSVTHIHTAIYAWAYAEHAKVWGWWSSSLFFFFFLNMSAVCISGPVLSAMNRDSKSYFILQQRGKVIFHYLSCIYSALYHLSTLITNQM